MMTPGVEREEIEQSVDAPPSRRSFEFIQVGDTASLSRRITEEDVRAFAELSGDHNPLHMDGTFARRTNFQRRVVHGMLLANYVSTLIGMQLPGPGALWTQQSFRWLTPVFIGDELSLCLTVKQKSSGTRTLVVEVKATNQDGVEVMNGEGSVLLVEERKRTRDVPLRERVALVTGASRGIGAAVALALGKAGAAVAINYLSSRADAEAVRSAILAEGGRAMTIQADVSDAAAVQEAVGAARLEFGRAVDVLVNNAGSPYVPRPFLETSWEEIQKQLDLQIRGAYYCCTAVIPGMKELRTGRIVNIGASVIQGPPVPNLTGFVIAKAALAAMTRSLAVELGQHGIRVNMVSPGVTETESIAHAPERLRRVQAMQTPLRRLASPEDIAEAVTALCSEAGEFVTGVDIPVCGGMRM